MAVEDFEVEEIPAYLPSGSGQHSYAWVQKLGLTTAAAIERICQAVGANAKGAGYAGLKDKHGLTRQWLSFDGVEPARLEGLELAGLRVLQVSRHRNRLRTGHLRGNRFTVRVHQIGDETLQRARVALARIGAVGLPNYFGVQRFGAAGDNADQALRALRGDQKLPRDRRRRRLLVSALQSALFNEHLAARLRDRRLSTVLDGDVLQRRDSGGLFVSDDRERDQARLASHEIGVTGPMPGPKMMRPREQSEARALEDAIFERYGVSPADFERFGKLALGTRRMLTVPVSDGTSELLADDALELRFSLPSGSYASVLLRELFKREMLGGARQRQAGRLA
jgi:tRNA pseudouridine13 synthase